jgi:hypothetical protein
MTTARSSPPDESTPSLARLIELALVVPVEVSSRLVEAVPAVVDKVPAAAGRIKREIVLARFLGKLAVDQGVRELRDRLTPAVPSFEPLTDAPDPVEVPSLDAHDSASELGAHDSSTLALADYDHLSSAQIVAKLEGLDTEERAALEEYERAGRHRRTILGKLDQLRTADERS